MLAIVEQASMRLICLRDGDHVADDHRQQRETSSIPARSNASADSDPTSRRIMKRTPPASAQRR